MSQGTRERKKNSSIPPPSKKVSSSTSSKSSSKSSSKPEKNEKSLKSKTDSTKSRSSSKEKESSKKNEEKKSKIPKLEKVEKSAKKVKPPPPPEPEPEEEYEYLHDDFEDYSDDFESDDSAVENTSPPSRKVSPPRQEKLIPNGKSIDIEEESPNFVEEDVEDFPLRPTEDTPMLRRLATSKGRKDPPPKVATPPKKETRVLSATERKIDFGTATTVDLAALSQSERRYQKLRELITLDSVKFVILDKPPVKDYDFYMQLFGEVGKTQAMAQTRDDDVTQSIQTEPPTTRSLWTQAPATKAGDWGGDEIARLETDDVMSIFRENHLENERLKRFLEGAAQVILDLMASRRRGGRLLDLGERSDLAFSAGVHMIKLEPLAQKYRCTSLARNERTSQILTLAFFVEQSVADDIQGRTLIMETILDSSRPPERLFLCDGEVSSMTYIPDGSALFAGMKDGSVSCFDLLEGDLSFFSRLPWIDSAVDLVLRRPSFDTSFLASALAADAASPMVSISATATQLSVLDSSATLYLYGIQRDDEPRPGKTAGARLSLALTAIVRPDSAVLRSSNQPTSLIATCMAVGEEGQFVIGTDAGFLCSMSRAKNSSSANVGPRLFRGKMQAFGEITVLRSCPSDSQLCLAGLSTGSLQLLRLDQTAPLHILTPPIVHRQPVTALEWSPTSTTGFYSWHGGKKILFWDLAIGKTPLTGTDLPSPVIPGVSLCWLESSDERVGFLAHAEVGGFVEVHALEPPKSTPMRVRSAVKKLESS